MLYKGFEFYIKLSSDCEKLVFSVPLCKSDGDISSSLKRQLFLKVKFSEGLPETQLHYDASSRQIIMTYSEDVNQFNYPHFEELIEELSWVAEERKKLLLSAEADEYEFVYIARP